MKKKKVLFLAESLNVGGAEKALVSLLKVIDYSRYDITLCLISLSGTFIEDLRYIPQLSIKHVIRPSQNTFLKFINAIKVKLIYSYLPASVVGNRLTAGYDVVIAFCEGNLTKWVAASTKKRRKIAWVHTDMVNNDWPVKTGVFNSADDEQHAYSQFDSVVAVSDVVADGMIKKYKCGSITTIYNIIDSDIISKSAGFTVELQKCALNLVSVGRLEYVKGYDRLIDALNVIVKIKKLNISLTIVGDGSQKQALEQKITDYNLGENIKLVGARSNPYPYVKAADCFICPSRQEGFNIAILEGMTLGKPVIATNTAGPQEILADGKYGILCSNSTEGLIEAIELIFRSDQLSRYAVLSHNRAKEFCADAQISKINQLLDF